MLLFMTLQGHKVIIPFLNLFYNSHSLYMYFLPHFMVTYYLLLLLLCALLYLKLAYFL